MTLCRTLIVEIGAPIACIVPGVPLWSPGPPPESDQPSARRGRSCNVGLGFGVNVSWRRNPCGGSLEIRDTPAG